MIRTTARTFSALSIVALTACAAHNSQSTPPTGPIDPATGVVKPADGSIPFYPGDLELRSVPSMPRVPKRDPAVNMALWTEELIGRPGAHFFVRNDTDKLMRITKVSIYECTNIEGGCVEYDPNLVLTPGQKVRLYTVVPHDRSKGYHYRWRASGGEERIAAPMLPNAGANTPRPDPQPMPVTPRPAVPRPNPAPTADRTAVAGVDPSGAVTHASGNPLDTQGATITIDATMPGDRSVRSVPPAIKFRSRRMRLTCDVDAKDVFGQVSVWIQVESPDGSTTAESSEATRISGTRTGHLSVTTSIPGNATSVTLALKLNGTGSVKATAFKFREVAPTPPKR